MAPVVTGQTQTSLEVVAGDDLTLTASISGFNLPLTSISWTQQGNTLTGSEERVTISNSTLTSNTATSTFLLSAVLPQDAGTYSITATNPAGSSNVFEFTVTVTGKDEDVFLKLIISLFLSSCSSN